MTISFKNSLVVLIVALGVLLALPMAIAHADNDNSGRGNSDDAMETEVEMHMRSSVLPLLPALGPEIKKRVQNARLMLTNTATTTRARVEAQVTTRIDGIHDLLGERKEDLRRILDERRNMVREHTDGVEVSAEARWSLSVQNHVRAIVGQLTAAVERLDVLAARLESRIGKLQADGTDMSDPITLLADARIDIAAAQDAVVAVSETLKTALESDSPHEHMSAVREAVVNAQEKIRTAHQALRDVLASVRLEVGVSPSNEDASN